MMTNRPDKNDIDLKRPGVWMSKSFLPEDEQTCLAIPAQTRKHSVVADDMDWDLVKNR